ncbi:MAG TPA: aliphatic sulfonate ABC transporter substrate-binding protein [Patescibacteria group bacterium]|nr:aliphatic sulfonate ABC transporter substrate-binding protein [Patescibacteria group bacterium]
MQKKLLRLPTCLLLVNLLLLTLLLVTGCQKQSAAPQILRLGFFPNLTHAPALIGVDQGFFQQQLGSVTLEIKTFNAGPELMEALAAGQLDIAYVGPGPALTGFARGLPVEIIAGANDAGAVLVAAPNSPIQSVKDLDGKKVAIPQLGNTQDISLRHLLRANQLQDKAKGGTVTIHQAAPADVLTLFTQGQIDAALVPEPWGVILEQKGNARLILNENQIWKDGHYPTTVFITTRSYGEQHKDLVQKMLQAHQQSVQFIQTNPHAALAAVNRQLLRFTNKEIPIAILETALSRTKAITTLDPATLQEYADISVEAGYIKNPIQVNNLLKTAKYLP